MIAKIFRPACRLRLIRIARNILHVSNVPEPDSRRRCREDGRPTRTQPRVRIELRKTSNRQHTLQISRTDGTRESVELVTREALFHDLLHFAVESALPTQRGFWGTLASGKTMQDLNDRTGEAVSENSAMLYRVEGIVGVMTGVVELPAGDAFAKLLWLCESQRRDPPDWCTDSFVADVIEQMRRLQGRWKATPFGEAMEIDWVDTAVEHRHA